MTEGNNAGNAPKIVVISGPSGGGKGTVIDQVTAKIPAAKTVSLTTRRPRPGEVDGVDYVFVTRENFGKLLSEGKILEFNLYDGCYYGTPTSAVDSILSEGKHVLLDVDVHGAINVKKKYPSAILLFLLPPSAEEQEARLRRRGTNTEESIARRMATTRSELRLAKGFDGVVVNEDGHPERAADAIVSAIAGKLPDKEKGRAVVGNYFVKNRSSK